MTADPIRILRFPTPRPTTAAYAADEALLGPSVAIARVWSQVRRVAPYFRAAVITGEPGSGAEAAARLLHALSPLNTLPLVTLDTAQAEAFFAADPLHELCEGLIFLRDVDRLSSAAQRGLLRKLRIRGRTPLRVVGSATTELRALVSAGRFSAALAEALGTVRIALPPLRERADDIPLLANSISRSAAERLGVPPPVLSTSFYEAAAAFPWPGNITQLAQVLHQLLSSNEADVLTAEHLAAVTESIAAPQSPAPAPTRMVRLEDVVQEHIRAVLIGCQGNKLRAAEILGISRSTLYRMLDGAAVHRPLSLVG